MTEHVIPVGVGVCSTAVLRDTKMLVDDVRGQDNYLACSLLGEQIAKVGQLIGQGRAIRTVDGGLLFEGKLEQRSGAIQVALLERDDRARSRVGHGSAW